MKRTLHLVRNDFLRLRGWLALWALVFAVKAGLGFYVRAITSEYSDKLVLNVTELTGALTTAQVAISFLLTLLLVQGDPLVGTRQFWITRPISGARLLVAKILGGALMLVGLPALILLPWWLVCGFGVPELASAIAQIAVVEIVIALPAAMVASLTDSVQRTVLWSVALIAVAMTGGVFWKTLILDRSGESRELAWTRTVLPFVTVIVTLASVSVLQFLTRRAKISFSVLGAGVIAAIVIAGAWPKTKLIPFMSRESHAERAVNVQVALEGRASVESAANKNEDANLRLSLTARGDTGGSRVVASDYPTFVWRWPDGFRLARRGRVNGLYRYFYAEDRNALHLGPIAVDAESEQQRDLEYQKRREGILKRHEAEDGERAKKGQRPQQHWNPPEKRPDSLLAESQSKADVTGFSGEVPVPAAFAERAQKEPPTFATKISLRLWRPEVWFEVPLLSDGWQRQGSRTVKMLRVGTDPKNRVAAPMTFVETAPFTWLEAWLVVCFPRRDREFVIYEQLRGRFWFMNRKLGVLEHDWFRDTQRTLLISGVQVTQHSAVAYSPQISRNGQWIDWQPDWRDNTALVMTSYREEARFEREITQERFEVKVK